MEPSRRPGWTLTPSIAESGASIATHVLSVVHPGLASSPALNRIPLAHPAFSRLPTERAEGRDRNGSLPFLGQVGFSQAQQVLSSPHRNNIKQPSRTERAWGPLARSHAAGALAVAEQLRYSAQITDNWKVTSTLGENGSRRKNTFQHVLRGTYATGRRRLAQLPAWRKTLAAAKLTRGENSRVCRESRENAHLLIVASIPPEPDLSLQAWSLGGGVGPSLHSCHPAEVLLNASKHPRACSSLENQPTLLMHFGGARKQHLRGSPKEGL